MENKVLVTLEDAEKIDSLPEEAKLEKVVDAKEVEARMVEEEKKRLAQEPDQEEVACMMLKLYTPRFHGLIDQLSNRQLRRVIKALIDFPLGKEYTHITALEKETVAVGQGLMDAKMVLVVKTYHDHKDEIIAGAEKATAEMVYEYGEPSESNNNAKVTNNEKGSN
jgi:deoxyribose-phosphate aldolase